MQEKSEIRVVGSLSYTLTRRKVKNINMRIRDDGQIAVSASRRVSAAAVDAFVLRNAAWVERSRARMQARRQREEASRAVMPDQSEALAHMRALCMRYYPEFQHTCPGGRFPKIAVRDMRTRWGSCSLRTGTLAFSLRLCTMPPAAQEYVVVHEFTHFAHPDHSPSFWAEVERHMPDYRQRRAMLR